MQPSICRSLLVIAILTAMVSLAATEDSSLAVTFDWATVGNPGNAADVQHDGPFGAVANSYRISKTEVTNVQYTEFLNAVADTDANGLYSALMGSRTQGGITRSGSSGSYTYAVKSDSIGNGPGGADGDDYTYGDKPVVFVSFFDAMRFTNWLQNGQPTGAQGASTTEDGVYAISDGVSEIRDPCATYFIPSEDEWYKAAYYDPNKSGGAGYYDYPTSTDIVPNNNLPSADTANSANFQVPDFNFTTGDFDYPMTDVGAYTQSESPYGTFDQGGNVWEWNEFLRSSHARGIRGGSWLNNSVNLLSSNRNVIEFTALEDSNVGIRVVSITPIPILGDMDFDCDRDFDDIEDFVLGLTNSAEYFNRYGVSPDVRGDIDGSGFQDFDDIDGFVDILTAPSANGLRTIPEPYSLLLGAMATVGLLLGRRRWS